MQKPAYLTISVDDGHPLDMRTAELLDRHGLKATFYVPAANPEREVMTKEQVRELSRRFEMGGHTYHHVPLASLPD
ncbi:MAG: polysaccharide deacetylase family protein [Verrucomicrobia bacterium]|nr:polysaccharide deacetylase family protein [Verrucomicrobiota bacterium]